MRLETFYKRFDFDAIKDITPSILCAVTHSRSGKLYMITKNRKGEFVAKKVLANENPEHIVLHKKITSAERMRVRKFMQQS